MAPCVQNTSIFVYALHVDAQLLEENVYLVLDGEGNAKR